MPLINTIEQDLINARIAAYKPMDDLKFLARELSAWKTSIARQEMLDGERYYSGAHDILRRQRMAVGKDGKAVAVDNLPNARIVDNQYAKHVEVKANYIVGKPITFTDINDAYSDALGTVLGARFRRTLKNAVTEAFNGGISWLYPYFDKNGGLSFKLFPAYEIMPFWLDSAHTELDIALRLYPVEVYEGVDKKIVDKVDVFTLNGVTTYTFDNGSLIPDSDAGQQSYIKLNNNGIESAFNWARLPLIPIKANAKEIPLIQRCRSLQDAINELESDFVNNMQQNVYNTVLVLQNYDGQDLGEFRQNLNAYGVVKVRTIEGVAGGVDTLEITVNAENYKTVLDLLKKALIENVRSYDAKDDRMSGSPNQMNIQSMYSDIDLDANAMELELQAAFEEILWFVNVYLSNSGKAVESAENVTVVFNRDVLINESEAIDNCAKSEGIISDETIISMHPWVNDPAAELKRLEEQKNESDPYRAAFEQAASLRNDKGGEPLTDEEQ